MFYRPSTHPARESKLEQTAQGHFRSLGYDFVTHVEGLPGRPDIVIPARFICVQVYGCFFHQHGPHCSYSRTPPSFTYDWERKFREIRIRDRSNLEQTLRRRYRQLTLWGCALEYGLKDRLHRAIVAFVEGTEPHREIGRLDLLAMPAAPVTDGSAAE